MKFKMYDFKATLILFASLLITSCGNFPDYSYDKSEEYCMMSFPVTGGFITRKYVGFFRIIATLQYLDADPSYKVIFTGPSQIKLEAGSLQQLLINQRVYRPQFNQSHIEGELQLWGPAFIFKQKESAEIYRQMQQGYNLRVKGRLEVGRQYDTDVYNFFFSSKDEKFKSCINRLLDIDDLKKLDARKKIEEYKKQKKDS